MNTNRTKVYGIAAILGALLAILGLAQKANAAGPALPTLPVQAGARCEIEWTTPLDTAVATAYEMSIAELTAGLQNGATLAELADNPVELLRLKAALLQIAQEKVDTAVSNETITPEQADKLMQLAPLAIDRLVENGGGPYWGQGLAGGRFWGHWRDTAASSLDLSVADLAGELANGSSLGEVAEAEGADVSVLVDALLVKATTALDQAVSNGLVTPEQAARLTQRLETAVTKLIYIPGPCATS
ncbi:MAG: hypothetical protein H6652_03255 [Ardenticatenaceae bacterium]|nr:hypothetical protein [Ardenticatenaceae bacterium]MCB8947993.1 hypothetical protein [Ardenticatenaceae bacterium]